MSIEKETRELIKRFCYKLKIMVFPNVRGNGYFGKTTIEGRTAIIENFRRMESGLAPGASDFIGITKVVITQDMVGKTVGIFTALEAKKNKFKRSKNSAREQQQEDFISAIRAKGGIAGFVSNQDDLELIFREYL